MRNLGWEAARRGRIDILDWLLSSAQDFGIGIDAWAVLNNASEAGHLDVLDWCVRRKVFDPQDDDAVKYTTESVVACAAGHGTVQVLDWWMQTLGGGERLQYSEWALDAASFNGHLKVLQWFKSNGLELKHHQGLVVDKAAAVGLVDVIQWWHSQHPLVRFMYTTNAADTASMNGHVQVLQWFLDAGLELKYTEQAIDCASQCGRVFVLDWWVRNRARLPAGLQFTSNALVHSHRIAGPQVLDWWRTSRLVLAQDAFFELDFTDLETVLGQSYAVQNALDAVVWGKANGYSVIADESHLKRAVELGRFPVVECLVDVVGVVPTASLVAELEMSQSVPVHIIDWLKSRID
ncbi:hypothetical protein BCR44DRAFT_1392096 [Catenaria anguillulae PL171]|uniref:Ankyrin repeat-containing domain protein n=1 Tax=Catenaria anguillulae PL171 TaxID=765915 RepID=A0A1Y2HC67_9FUNG|nr:hypothetical protein BCR44DRAFT_1392096 [Catenaria anguillulae PL171]